MRWSGSGEVARGDCDSGDCCGLCAQDTGTQGYGDPVVEGKQGHLFRGPAALGPDCKVEALVSRWRGAESGGEGRGLLGFGEEDASDGGFVLEGWLEGGGGGDGGDAGAAGLLG